MSTKKEPKKKLKLMDTRDYYKPFNYPWAYDAFVASSGIVPNECGG